jgi:hypothetical protein
MRLELERTTACGVHLKGECVKFARDAQLNEQLHLIGGKTNEVQVAEAFADFHWLQLQVEIAYARLAVRRVANEVVTNRAQDFALFNLLVAWQVERLEVDEFDERAADVNAKPWKILWESFLF